MDDLDFGITHVIRGSDHRANAELQSALIAALGGTPPEYIHHGLLLGEDGQKLSKRHGASSLADLREAGIPAEAVRAYLEELGLPRHDVNLDLSRLRRLSIEALGACPTTSSLSGSAYRSRLRPCCAARATCARHATTRSRYSSLRGSSVDAPETLERLRELVEGGVDPKGIVRELKAVGGNLKAVRLALTGRERGPELAAMIAALPREELLPARLGRCASTTR